MMLVGFGDMYPVTHFGRAVIVMACFWGIFIVSMFVYTMELISAFTKTQSLAYQFL